MDAAHSEEFIRLFYQFVDQVGRRHPPLEWSKIRPLSEDRTSNYSSLAECPSDPMVQHELLQKLAIVKLNGGLGTTMGCEGPKSAIEVRSGLTFLDLTVRQVEYLNTKYGVDVPLILMNSFKTNEETIKIIRKYSLHNLTIHCFNQSCFPCVDGDHYSPMPTGPFSPETSNMWYPPGHGDVYRALVKSGVLPALIRQGKEYLFISNVDNLGATVDLNIMYHVMSKDIEFCMELTDRTRADVQGGILTEYEGKPKLVEAVQVPPEHLHEFHLLKKFNLFNTNNLWVSLRAVQRLIASNAIRSAVIVNTRVEAGRKMLQLETAAGAAIEFFGSAVGLRVPRSRFLPVKRTSDLMSVQSNLYEVKHGALIPSPVRHAVTTPIIKLGPEFASLHDFQVRMAHIPDISDLEHLTVSGDVYFGRDVVIKGTVIIVANEGSRIDLPDGSVLEDKVVTGHLRILEH